MDDVFVSHANSDDEIANRIHNTLLSAEIKDWIDHLNLKPADNWHKSIQQALNTCECGLFILSLNSCEREECINEWRTILDLDKNLYVVLTETIPKDKFPYRLRTTQYTDLTLGFDEGIKTLASAIKNKSALDISVPTTIQVSEVSENDWIIVPNLSAEKNEITSMVIVLNIPFENFDEAKQLQILRLVAKLGSVGVPEIRIVSKTKGSVILTLQMKSYVAERVMEAARTSQILLAQYGVVSVEPIITDQTESQPFRTQAKPNFRKNWSAWAKQLPRIKFDAAPNPNFQLIDQQKLKELTAKADQDTTKRILEDIEFLDHHVLRLFRERDYAASFQQNRYRLFQILFLILPFIATIIGGLQAFSLVINPNRLPTFAFIETLVALIGIFLATISTREPPLPLWLNNRRRAESLRREYFRYLMRVKPYDDLEGNDLQMELTRRAADINRGQFLNEQPKQQVATAAPKLKRTDLETRFALFEKSVLNDQRNYYKTTVDIFRKSVTQINYYRAFFCFIIGLSSAVAGLIVQSSFIPNGCIFQKSTGDCVSIELMLVSLVLFSIIAPLLSAFFNGLVDLYQWDRGVTIYDTAIENLEVVDAQAPLQDMTSDIDYYASLDAYVEATLNVMRSEAAQWGQLIDTPSSLEKFVAQEIMSKSEDQENLIDPSHHEPPSQQGSSKKK